MKLNLAGFDGLERVDQAAGLGGAEGRERFSQKALGEVIESVQANLWNLAGQTLGVRKLFFRCAGGDPVCVIVTGKTGTAGAVHGRDWGAVLLGSRWATLLGQFLLHGLAAGVEGVTDLLPEGVQVLQDEQLLELEFHVTAGSQGAVIGEADLFAEADGGFQGHGRSPMFGGWDGFLIAEYEEWKQQWVITRDAHKDGQIARAHRGHALVRVSAKADYSSRLSEFKPSNWTILAKWAFQRVGPCDMLEDMGKKAIISLDLSTFAGTMKYVPGNPLSRTDKQALERHVAEAFLEQLASAGAGPFANLRSCETDPPDVVFNQGAISREMELVELIPLERHGKDAILRKLRAEILTAMQIGSETRGWVVNISFHTDYESRLRTGRIADTLARTLDQTLQDPKTANIDTTFPKRLHIEVPSNLSHLISHISCFREEPQADDPRLSTPDEPLILFPGAQSTLIIPAEDCVEIVQTSLHRKNQTDAGSGRWLLTWSSHPAITGVLGELVTGIANYVNAGHLIQYERIFHYDHASKRDLEISRSSS